MAFDKSILARIIMHFDDIGQDAHVVEHIGNNVFSLNVTESELGPMCGYGHMGLYTIEDNKVVCKEVTGVWMS